MIATLALLVCLIGWAFLVRSGEWKRESFDFGLWVALVWLLIEFSRPVNLWFQSTYSLDAGDVAAAWEGNTLNRNVDLVFLTLGSLILVKRNLRISELVTDNKLLCCLVAYCAVSAIWSDFPFIVLKRWVRHLNTMIFVLILLTDKGGFTSIIRAFRYIAYILLPISIVLFKYYPSLGRSYHPHSGGMFITGVTTNKNHLGLLCMTSALFLLFEIYKQWSSGNRRALITKADLCFFAVAVWLLYFCKSATSLFAFMAGAVTYFALAWRPVRAAKTPWMFLTVLALTLAIPVFYSGAGEAGGSTSIASVVDLTGHSETFWGRTELWKLVIGMVDNPLLGCGYTSFWLGPERMATLRQLYWWHPTEAHNGFVGVYLSLGLIGVALVSVIFVQSYRRLFRLLPLDSDYARIGLSFVTAGLLYNVTEDGFLGLNQIWFIVLLVSIRVSSAPAEASDALKFSAAASEWISA